MRDDNLQYQFWEKFCEPGADNNTRRGNVGGDAGAHTPYSWNDEEMD